MAFHDLTSHDKPYVDIKTLLGLGLKICIHPRGVQLSNMIRMIDRFKRDVRLKDYLMSNSFDVDNKIPRLCKKNDKWQPPKAVGLIEDFLKEFETSMNLETSKRAHLKSQIY